MTGSVLSLGCISSSPVSSCSICRSLTSCGAARPWQSLWQFITSEKCHYAVGGTDYTAEQSSSVLWSGAGLSRSCWSPDFEKQMKRKADRRDNSLRFETSYETKAKENIWKTTAGGQWLHKMGWGVVWWEMLWVSLFRWEFLCPAVSCCIMPGHESRDWAGLGWAGLGWAGLGWDTNYGDGVGDTSLQTHQAHGHRALRLFILKTELFPSSCDAVATILINKASYTLPYASIAHRESIRWISKEDTQHQL